MNLALQVRRKVGEISEVWLSRIRGGRISISPRHDDFPAVLAESLDVLTAAGMDVSEAAQVLQCSSSQLTKLLKLEPRAMHLVNQTRRKNGLHPLR